MTERPAPPTMVIGQSGGATAVINASLVGAIQVGLERADVGRVLGMHNGIEGLLTGRFTELGDLSPEERATLGRTPSAALGTGRYKLRDADLGPILEICERENIRWFLYIGGNDSADTALRLARHADTQGSELRVMSIPKTIDNDLPEMHVCPGYGSIARYLANATRDAIYDTIASPQLYPVKFIEVMGRDAGWVTAACALGTHGDESDLAPLLLLPERPPASTDEVLDLVRADVARRGWSVVVVPETLRDAEGRHLGGDTPDYVDAFGHEYFPSTGAALSRLLTSDGIRARYEKPGTAARMSISMASPVDLEQAGALGRMAAEAALDGVTAHMPAVVSFEDGWSGMSLVPVDRVANRVRVLDEAFIGGDGHSVTQAFLDYALPLLGPEPFPPYARLR
ncbi:MAG TPA: diphosphate--fructose-6-phosphate 1-phosphotransferase [Thermomicrobiales bacterium]|nr:diphosphate--fructose-6-phosphate 1-phosphotransferase [Thermomicrobiales bacterium]